MEKTLYDNIARYLEENFIAPPPVFFKAAGSGMKCKSKCVPAPSKSPDALECSISPDLMDALENADESFADMLFREIDNSGMTDAQCYKKANIDRKLFSKIRSDRLYKPSKPTVIALIFSLELPLERAEILLKRAGFALSNSSKFDIIVEYFIVHEMYDLITLNEALYEFDQPLVGA